jgi:hypothetical protein
VNDRIASSIETILGYVQSTAELVKEQAPLVVQELIRWGIVWGVLSVILSAALFALCCFALPRGYRLAKECPDYSGDEPVGVGIVCASALLGVASVCEFIHAIRDVMLAVFAPRLFVIEYLRGLVQ